MDAPESPMTDESAQSNNAPLSPPGSQGADTVTSSTRASRNMPANTNGKRPLDHISNGSDLAEDDAERMSRVNVSTSRPGSSGDANGTTFQPQTHTASGYRWEKPEDAPGHGWLNKKAQDESARVWETLVHRDSAINGRYGDPIELAEHEAAYTASLSQ